MERRPLQRTTDVDESNTYQHDDEVIVTLSIDGDIIETTPEHPFYTDDSVWVDAAELEVGERIWSLDGDYGTVEAVLVINDANQPMYNLTVDEAHTFFIGDGDWLVHNITFKCTPYNSRVWRDYYESTGAQVTSTTIPPSSGRGTPHVGLSNAADGDPSWSLSTENLTITLKQNGNDVEVVVPWSLRGTPIFDNFSVFDTRIDLNLAHQGSRRSHMRAATRSLRDFLNVQRTNVGGKTIFTADYPAQFHRFNQRQLRAIHGGRPTIPNFTWHHHEHVGRLQLIPRNIHEPVTHIAGHSLWKGR